MIISNRSLHTEIRSGFEENRREFKELRSEIHTVKDIALVNSAKIDAYRDFTSIWFTVLAVIVALVGVMATLAPMFRDIYKDAKQARKNDEIRNIARDVMHEEISLCVRNAVADALNHSLRN